MMYTLVIMVTAVSHLSLYGYLPIGNMLSLAGWSQTYSFESDCNRAGEAITKEFSGEGVTVKTKCVLVR